VSLGEAMANAGPTQHHLDVDVRQLVEQLWRQLASNARMVSAHHHARLLFEYRPRT
jgi:hypothetical protein